MPGGDKRVIIADLDDTLTKSKSRMDAGMARILCGLLGTREFAIISGGSFAQFQKQVLDRLSCGGRALAHLYIFPTNATAMYRFRSGKWRQVYTERLTWEEKAKIVAAFGLALEESKFRVPRKLYGQQIEDRGTQITFSALGQAAPYALKAKWDPRMEKRQRIKRALQRRIPEFQIGIGGKTSIDVTRRGRDKAYGVRKIADALGCRISDMLYIGDALFRGGNDYPARSTGIKCVQVKTPADTKRVLLSILAGNGGK